MKYIHFIIASFICTISQAQIISFPDANFKQALLNHIPVIDTNRDGEIQVSEAEEILSLLVPSQNIASLEGIEYFINIEYLNCRFNLLTTLDLSQNKKLDSLRCDNNQLLNLNLSNLVKLWTLDVFDNNLVNLDISDCSNLTWIFASRNNLENFDISQNHKVIYLDLNSNNLLSLNIRNNYTSSLTLMDARGNNNLGCIQVDDVNYPRTRYCTRDFWCIGPPYYNPNSFYSEDCSLNSEEFTRNYFSISPNPVKNILTVNSQESIEFLKIFSINGKLLKKTTESIINVSELASGLYFIVVSIEGRTDTKKFIKN